MAPASHSEDCPKPVADEPLVVGEGGGEGLTQSLLDGGDGEPKMTAEEAEADRRSLIVSILTLALSIPALIGA